MEVTGRKVHEKDLGGKFCKNCENKDYRIQAFVYCQNCKINLCRKCFETHKSDKRTSFHDTERCDMIKANDQLPFCTKHENEVIKYYCRLHEYSGCNVCILQHKECDLDYIPGISTQFIDMDEYKHVQICMQVLKGRISEGIDKMKENIWHYENAYQTITTSIRAMKTKFMESLDLFEKELEKEAQVYRKECQDKMAQIKFDLDVLETELSSTETLISNLEKQSKRNLQFLEAKNAQTKISNYFQRVYDIAVRNRVDEIIFCPSKQASDIFTRENVFGTISTEVKEMEPCNLLERLETQNQWHINIKSESDRKTCYVTGLALLSADHLAIADKANRSVKIVDVSHDNIVSTAAVSSSPRDITVIPPDQLAVTLRDEECIQLLSTSKGLLRTKQIKTAGNCRGIKYNDGKLIVAYDGKIRPKIEILRLNGDVLCQFLLNESGSMIFAEPKCIGVSPNSNRMYISDVSKMYLFCLSKVGKIIGTFGRHRYMGIAVSAGGSVYACSKSGNTVFQLPDDLSEDKTVLTINDGIKNPISLAISDAKNMLYVSCGSSDASISNILHGFKIKPRGNDTRNGDFKA